MDIERTRNFKLPEIVDNLTRREFLAGAGLIVLVPGCGNGGESGDEETSAETRTVEHALGETEVPVRPERLVVMDGEFTLDPVVALGLDPIGAARPDYTGEIPTPIRRRIESDLAEVGTQSEPSLERIAALEPELILGMAHQIEGIYARLSDIAPTVALNHEQTRWKAYLREVGDVLGRSAEARRLLEDYEARTAEITERLGSRLDELAITMARATDLGFRYLTLEGSFPGTVLREVGLKTPPEQRPGGVGEPFVEISQEEIPVLEADYIFLTVDEGSGVPEGLESNPLWSRLEGEKARVGSSGWVFGNVLTAANILDDLEKYLLEAE